MHRQAIVLFCVLGASSASSGQGAQIHKKPFRDQFKTAPDGVTKGWTVEIPWPDEDDQSQSWRTIGVKVVLSRRGHIVRHIDGGVGIWNWAFWKGGQQVAIERGPVHGETSCSLIDITSGRSAAEWPGDCRSVSADDHVPDWVKAASGCLKATERP